MDGLSVTRSVTLSNPIAKTPQPEGVVVRYHQAQKERGHDNTIMQREERTV